MLKDYFDTTFQDLIAVCSGYKVTKLIGASGSFEVVEELSGQPADYLKVNDVTIEEFHRQYSMLENTTSDVRKDKYDVPENRAKLIVVAMILMEYIISRVHPALISVSPYAMKEGIIREMKGM